MTKLKKYDLYKNSGVAWLGEIPAHWEVKKLKFISKIKTGYTPDTTQSKNYSENGIVWVKPDDLNEFILITNSKEKINPDYVKKQNIILKGSILVNCIGNIGKFGIAGVDLVTNQQINSVTFNTDISSEFQKYLIFASKNEHFRYSNGNVVQILNTFSQGQINLPIPPKTEQQKIAQFLDEKTNQIDQSIAQKQKLIELLKEQKQIVINDAVTKGLDPNVELKESEIDWIGKIPKHWDNNKLKNVVNNKTAKAKESDFKIGLENIESFTSKYIETTENIFSESGINFNKGDVLFGKLRPYLAKVYLTEQNGLCVSEFLVLESKNIYNQYLKLLLLSSSFLDYVNGSTYGTKMPRASWDFVGNSKIPVPPIQEQQQIADYLDSKITQIDDFITLTQKQIEKLQEYKTVLIDNVVTGKVRVA